MTTKLRHLATPLVILSLMAPSAAIAQSSNGKGYGGNKNDVAGLQQGSGGKDDDNTGTPSAAAPAQAADTGPKATTGSSLPFTGADLGVLAAAGAILLGTGVGLRRLTARSFQS